MIDWIIFLFLQGLFINGISLSMGEGMILSRYKNWLKKRHEWIGKPFGLCVMCMSSVFGTITFWPMILYIYGFRPIELFAWVIDCFSLVSISLWVYKKI